MIELKSACSLTHRSSEDAQNHPHALHVKISQHTVLPAAFAVRLFGDRALSSLAV